jgi:hypothetical protein
MPGLPARSPARRDSCPRWRETTCPWSRPTPISTVRAKAEPQHQAHIAGHALAPPAAEAQSLIVLGSPPVLLMDDQPAPHTVASLKSDLRSLGLVSGDVAMLHASRSSVGFVAGGPQAIVQALLEILGQQGTLVVPTHTPENTDPATWRNPPVPQSWWPVIREQSPGFDPELTPASRWMGISLKLCGTGRERFEVTTHRSPSQPSARRQL